MPGATKDPLLVAVEQAGLQVTVADVAARTGLAVREVEPQLNALAKKYRCALRVDDAGHITYAFGPTLRPWSNRAPWSAWWSRAFERVSSGLRFAFKLVMAGLLLTYALLFILPLALVVGIVGALVSIGAAMITDLDVAGLVIELLQTTLGAIIGGVILAVIVIYITYKTMGEAASFILTLGHGAVAAPKRKGLVGQLERLMERLYLFAMGPTRPAGPDPHEDDGVVLDRVRRRGGFLVSADLVEWKGLNLDAAEQVATRLLVHHLGEPIVAPPGVVAHTFPDLMITAQSRLTEAPSRLTAFEAMERAYDLTGNSRSADRTILASLGAMLIGGVAVVLLTHVPVVPVVLGWVPAGFAGAVLAFPALRWPFVTLLNRGVMARNTRRVAFGRVFEHLQGRAVEGDVATPEGLTQATLVALREWTKGQGRGAADVRAGDEAIEALREMGEHQARAIRFKRVSQVVRQVIHELDGAPDIAGDRPQALVFEELQRQQEAIAELIRNPPAHLRLVGPTIYDSEGAL